MDAVKDKIGDLLDLGVHAVELMPWTAWRGGEFSWGYDPFLFFSVEDRCVADPLDSLDRLYRRKTLVNALLDSLDRLYRRKTLVNVLHGRGVHVVLDGVFHHIGAGLDPGNGFPYRRSRGHDGVAPGNRLMDEWHEEFA